MTSSVLPLARHAAASSPNSPHSPHSPRSPQLAQAVVSGCADDWFFVDGVNGASGSQRALRAASCLLEPQIGDTVLLCAGGTGVAPYILAILARVSSSGGTLTLPGGGTIVGDDGRLCLTARSVELAGEERVTLAAPRLDVLAADGELRFSRLGAFAKTLDARVGVLSLVAGKLTSSVGRLVQKARDCFRSTENLDETRAGRLRLKVDGRYQLDAGHAAILAEGLVKIDGEKIDLG